MAIKFDERNYRKHSDKNKDLINKSLKECGAGRSIVIDNENNIIAGNGIYEQSLKLGLKTKVIETDGSELVVVKRTDLATDDEKRKQLAVMDNSTSDSSEFDFELLQADFDIETIKDFGIDVDFELEEEQQEVIEDEVPEQVETRCKLGDIWQLGEHRLMCGDSTEVDDVEKLMNGKKADMVFTDPPYGMNLNTDFSDMNTVNDTLGKKESKKYNKVIGDNEDFTPELINNIFTCFDYCKEIFLWGADYYSDLLINKENGSWFVWDKRCDETFDEAYGSAFELCFSKSKHKREIVRVRWVGVFGTEKEDTKKRVHPTQKPITLIKCFLEKFSKDNNLIVDLFGGSGSTLIACEQLNRKCYTMELDEYYCDVIITRWENLTGQKAVLING